MPVSHDQVITYLLNSFQGYVQIGLPFPRSTMPEAKSGRENAHQENL
jgi:hypothetical protein